MDLKKKANSQYRILEAEGSETGTGGQFYLGNNNICFLCRYLWTGVYIVTNPKLQITPPKEAPLGVKCWIKNPQIELSKLIQTITFMLSLSTK